MASLELYCMVILSHLVLQIGIPENDPVLSTNLIVYPHPLLNKGYAGLISCIIRFST